MNIETPARIYVLWHPGFKQGLALARRLYHWFRLANGEGIPIYFRCPLEATPASVSFPDGCARDIIIPLVDSNMVASLTWRERVEELVLLANENNNTKPDIYVLPVALDSTSYNMPKNVRKLNFIRHVTETKVPDEEELLVRLTYAISQIFLSAVRFNTAGPVDQPAPIAPIKIFISHAKADGTDVPKQIKQFIQTETQCHTFFDENDISYGVDYGEIIDKAVRTESAGLLIVQGDNYAERPWCRREIRDFLKPRLMTYEESQDDHSHLFSIMPPLVVTNYSGNRIARSIPELGHAPCMQWKDGQARGVVVALLREVLFAGFYRLLAQATKLTLKQKRATGLNVLFNRAPDPIMLEAAFRQIDSDKRSEKTVVWHPGHGLTSVERGGLKLSFPNVTFNSFNVRGSGGHLVEEIQECLGKVLAVSVSNSEDILNRGIADEHVIELLRDILRPLYRKGYSLLYGGKMESQEDANSPWERQVNYTHSFLEHLLADGFLNIAIDECTTSNELIRPRLFNILAWPFSKDVSVFDEANWIEVCSFIRVPPADFPQAGNGVPVEPVIYTREWRAARALELTKMRAQCCAEIQCDVPGARGLKFETTAHIFVGGKMLNYLGGIPGVWEEILHALDADRPVFLIGACEGATRKIADWMVDCPSTKPVEFDHEYHIERSSNPDAFRDLVHDIELASPLNSPQQQLDRLWNHISSGSGKSLAHLTAVEIKELATTDNFDAISQIIQNGLRKVPS